jgi:hypothetical protein
VIDKHGERLLIPQGTAKDFTFAWVKVGLFQLGMKLILKVIQGFFQRLVSGDLGQGVFCGEESFMVQTIQLTDPIDPGLLPRDKEHECLAGVDEIAPEKRGNRTRRRVRG